MHFVRHSVRP